MLGRLVEVGRELTQGLLQLAYPGFCVVCGQSVATELVPFCTPCRAALTCDPVPTCPRCASSVGPFALVDNGCSRCRATLFHFDKVQRLGRYQPPLRDLILRLKSWSGEMLAEQLGELWAEHADFRLRELHADVVIPVPLHWRRQWWRGYNQSEALAQALAVRLQLPCQPRWLRRIRHTPKQTSQSRTARRDNVKGAFRARSGVPLQGKTILLVDDVLTTGSTCSEAAGALRHAGAERVVVAVLAHGRS